MSTPYKVKVTASMNFFFDADSKEEAEELALDYLNTDGDRQRDLAEEAKASADVRDYQHEYEEYLEEWYEDHPEDDNAPNFDEWLNQEGATK